MALKKRHVKNVVRDGRCRVAPAGRFKRFLQQLKIGNAVGIEYHDFTIQPGTRHAQGGKRLSQLRELCSPVMAIAREAMNRCVVQPCHQPVAIKFQLVKPCSMLGWRVRQGSQLRCQFCRQICFYSTCWQVCLFNDFRRYPRFALGTNAVGQGFGDVVAACRTFMFIVLFDQQPCNLLFAMAAHTHQRPEPLKFVATQFKLQFAVCKTLSCIAFR